jgi:hypothetical protein
MVQSTMKYAALLVAATAACTGACTHIRVVHNEDEAVQQIGRIIEFQGTAVNCKMAAAVITDGLTIHCMNFDFWSDGLLGRPVRIRGRIEYTIKDPDSDGSRQEQRITGAYFSIQHCEQQRLIKGSGNK